MFLFKKGNKQASAGTIANSDINTKGKAKAKNASSTTERSKSGTAPSAAASSRTNGNGNGNGSTGSKPHEKKNSTKAKAKAKAKAGATAKTKANTPSLRQWFSGSAGNKQQTASANNKSHGLKILSGRDAAPSSDGSSNGRNEFYHDDSNDDGDNSSLDMSLYTSMSKSTVHYNRHTISNVGGAVMDDCTIGTNGAYDTEVVQVLLARKSLGMHPSPEPKPTRYGNDSKSPAGALPSSSSSAFFAPNQQSASPATNKVATDTVDQSATKHMTSIAPAPASDIATVHKSIEARDGNQDLSVPDLQLTPTSVDSKPSAAETQQSFMRGTPINNTKGTANRIPKATISNSSSMSFEDDRPSASPMWKHTSQVVNKTPSNVTAVTTTSSMGTETSSASTPTSQLEMATTIGRASSMDASPRSLPSPKSQQRFDLAYWQSIRRKQLGHREDRGGRTTINGSHRHDALGSNPRAAQRVNDDDHYTGPVDLDLTIPDDGALHSSQLLSAQDRLGLAVNTETASPGPSANSDHKPRMDRDAPDDEWSAHSSDNSLQSGKPSSEATLKMGSTLSSIARYSEMATGKQNKVERHRQSRAPLNPLKIHHQKQQHRSQGQKHGLPPQFAKQRAPSTSRKSSTVADLKRPTDSPNLRTDAQARDEAHSDAVHPHPTTDVMAPSVVTPDSKKSPASPFSYSYDDPHAGAKKQRSEPSQHSHDSSTLWQFSPQNSQHTRGESIGALLTPTAEQSRRTFDHAADPRGTLKSQAEAASLYCATTAINDPTVQVNAVATSSPVKPVAHKRAYNTGPVDLDIDLDDVLSQPSASPKSCDDSLLHSSPASSTIMWDMLSQNTPGQKVNANGGNGPALLLSKPILVRDESEGASTLDNSSVFQFSPQSYDVDQCLASPAEGKVVQQQQQQTQPAKVYIGAMQPKSLLGTFTDPLEKSKQRGMPSRDEEFSVASVEEWSDHLTEVTPTLLPPPPPPEAAPMPHLDEQAMEVRQSSSGENGQQRQLQQEQRGRAQSNVVMVAKDNSSSAVGRVAKKTPPGRSRYHRNGGDAMNATLSKSNLQPGSAKRHHPWSMPQSKYFMTNSDHSRSINQGVPPSDEIHSSQLVNHHSTSPALSPLSSQPRIIASSAPSPSSPAHQQLGRGGGDGGRGSDVRDITNGEALMDQDSTTSFTEVSEGYISFGLPHEISNDSSDYSFDLMNASPVHGRGMDQHQSDAYRQRPKQFEVYGGPVGNGGLAGMVAGGKLVVQQDDALSDMSSTIHKRMFQQHEDSNAIMVTAAMLSNATKLLDLTGCVAPNSKQMLQNEYEYHDRDDDAKNHDRVDIASIPLQLQRLYQQQQAQAHVNSHDRSQDLDPASSERKQMVKDGAALGGEISDDHDHGMRERRGEPRRRRHGHRSATRGGGSNDDDLSTSSEESAGAVLLTKAELDRHMKRLEGKVGSPPRQLVPAEERDVNPLAGYQLWSMEREKIMQKQQKLAKQQAKAEKKEMKKRRGVHSRGGSVNTNPSTENDENYSIDGIKVAGGIQKSRSAPSHAQRMSQTSPTVTTATSLSAFAPTSSAPGSGTGTGASMSKPPQPKPPQSKRTMEKKSGKRRWRLFGRRKKDRRGTPGKANTMDKMGVSEHEDVLRSISGDENISLQLADFISVTHDRGEIEEPTEVAELSLAPMDAAALECQHPNGDSLNNDNRTAFLAQQHLEKERRKETEARTVRSRWEKREAERIRHLKEQALIEARRKEASGPPPSHSLRRVPSKTKSLGEQLSVIDSISHQRGGGHHHRSCSKSMDGSFASYPSTRDTPSVSALSKQSLGSSTIMLAPCTICGAAERTHIAMPCMHYAFCGECVEELQAHGSDVCPVCEVTDIAFTKVLLN